MKYKQLTNNTKRKSLKTKNPLYLIGLCGASIPVQKLLENELVFVVYFEVKTFLEVVQQLLMLPSVMFSALNSQFVQLSIYIFL